jgi:hypothetical protein
MHTLVLNAEQVTLQTTFMKKTIIVHILAVAVAKHAYEEGHKVGWDETSVLNIESHSKYRKYKEAAHMACYIDPISQPSLDISPIWIPIISNEVSSSQRRSI